MRKNIYAILVITTLLTNPLCATIWNVGPAQTYTMPSQVAPLVNHGDTINIDAGIYNSNVCAWNKNNLLIRCVNGMAHLKSNGLSHADKGIWVIQGNNTTVDHIEFSLCTSTSQNGAGIRQEGQNLIVRYCYFHDNENGILAGAITPCKITVEFTEFNLNGAGDGFSHNLYIGHVDTLLFRYNYSHHCKIGHELKSRAKVNYILYNRFGNEASGTASREIDLPNGGLSIIMGNQIQQGVNGTNSGIIGYGLEGLTNPAPNNFYLINNTIVNEKTVGTFVAIQNGTALYKGYNNIFAGTGTLLTGTTTVLDTLSNKKYTIAAAGFVNSATYNYHLLPPCSAINSATAAGTASNGYVLAPIKEYLHPVNQINRTVQGILDIGAYEYVSPTFIQEQKINDAVLFVRNETLIIKNSETISCIKLYDISGKLILTEKTKQDIPVSTFVKGIYIVSIITESGNIINKKIVIY
ncbi:MAG: T9SS type A sorting domain-containing protein [Bacteroidota bacterium]|nr:T9SS type A sorting domain-containing protein [Bacteroidota bacterium]MDP3146917.1 T9SS type A sorting domain-containing protein [Bacteroidota bacterium]